MSITLLHCCAVRVISRQHSTVIIVVVVTRRGAARRIGSQGVVVVVTAVRLTIALALIAFLRR